MHLAQLRGYLAARTVPEALEAYHGSSWHQPRFIAGGQSLMPLLRARTARPDALIDLNGIVGLRQLVVEEHGGLSVGAMATHRDVAADPKVQRCWAAVSDAAGQIGDVQVRNRGTIGGNVAHADLASDMPPALVAAGADVHLVDRDGRRRVAAGDFFVAAGQTRARSGELLERLTLPAPPPRTGSAYLKYGITASGRPVVGVAAALGLAEDGTVSWSRLVVGGFPAGPIELGAAQDALAGVPPDAQAIARVAALAGQAVPHFHDLRAGGAYRRQLTTVYVERALRLAAGRAGGEQR